MIGIIILVVALLPIVGDLIDLFRGR